jgi:hypothetical protein
MQIKLVINPCFDKILSMKVNYIIQNNSETIDNVISEMEDFGYISPSGPFNFINEVRGWMGEEDFYKFLEDLVNTWDIESLFHHFE